MKDLPVAQRNQDDLNAAPKNSMTRHRRSQVSANMEDYLETIFRLNQANGSCRVTNIAETLGVKCPSVTKALKRLKEQGFIHHTPYGEITMTKLGMQVAQHQVRCHRALIRFLTEVLKLPEELAEHDACLMEHAISHETVERLVEFIENGYVLDRPNEQPKEAAQGPHGASDGETHRTWTSKV